MPPTSRSVPVELLLRVEDALGRVADVGEDPVAQLQQRLADRRDLDAPPEPDEQRLLELFLEQQDLSADRRLGDMQAGARRGEGPAFGDRSQDFELSQIHGSQAARPGSTRPGHHTCAPVPASDSAIPVQAGRSTSVRAQAQADRASRASGTASAPAASRRPLRSGGAARARASR